jgi:hypothetical protein
MRSDGANRGNNIVRAKKLLRHLRSRGHFFINDKERVRLVDFKNVMPSACAVGGALDVRK